MSCNAFQSILFLICMDAALGSVKANEGSNVNCMSNLSPTGVAIADAVHCIKRTHCMTAACKATLTLDHLFDIILAGEATTMGDAHYFNANQPYIEEKRLHRALLDHPNRFPPMCALLTSLVSRYGRPGSDPDKDDDLFVGVHSVDLALRMDGYGPAHCLPAVLAAMPHTTEADTAIGNARDICEGQPVAHDPCARIAR